MYPFFPNEFLPTWQFTYFCNLCSLKPIDIVVLKKLSEVVNVVPVIAKSDALTLEERAAFKMRVRCFSTLFCQSIDVNANQATITTNRSSKN